MLSIVVRCPRIVGGRQFTFDPTFIIFIVIGDYDGTLVRTFAIVGPGLLSNRCSFSWLGFGGVSSQPLGRTVLVVVRVPLTIGFDNDVLHRIRCRVQDVTKVPIRRLACTRKKCKLVDPPIKHQLFWFQHFLTNRAEPRCRLFHHAVPRCCIEALRVDTFLRPGGEVDAGVAQLLAEGMRLPPSESGLIGLTGHFSDIFCSPAMISSSSATLCFPESTTSA